MTTLALLLSSDAGLKLAKGGASDLARQHFDHTQHHGVLHHSGDVRSCRNLEISGRLGFSAIYGWVLRLLRITVLGACTSQRFIASGKA
jgi:hypothetical protein